MAVLSDLERQRVAAIVMRETGSNFGGILKADLQAAVNAADVWADANAASFNTALPLPARNAMTLVDKTKLLSLVIQVRAGLR